MGNSVYNLHLFPLSDDYFVSNIEKVDSVTLLRKDKVMTGISWSVKFQRSLDTWPCLNDLGATAAQVQLSLTHLNITRSDSLGHILFVVQLISVLVCQESAEQQPKYVPKCQL